MTEGGTHRQQEVFSGKSILVTGGTGSFGNAFVRHVLEHYDPRRIIIFSRDEWKQDEMRRRLPPEKIDKMRFFLGDVRDRNRLYRAFNDVDIVIHAAALKQVPACEYNPMEAIQTNVMGAANVADAAIDNGVGRVLALSTDKAASPVNLYGATKLCSDKLFIAAMNYNGLRDIRFSVVRYGNVLGSRGSVLPLFLEQRQAGRLTITDARMTRFLLTLRQGVGFVLESLARMQGGEIFVPRIPSANVIDLAHAVAPEAQIDVIGARPGEKLHEQMITKDDARSTFEFKDFYVIATSERAHRGLRINGEVGAPCGEGFEYDSGTNAQWLDQDGIRAMCADAGFTL